MRGKKQKKAVVEALQKIWREGKVRQATREASALDDAAIESALDDGEVTGQLSRYARLMLRESLLGIVAAQIERAGKDTQGAKQFFELAQAAKLLDAPLPAPDPEADMNELEQSVLAGLRSAMEPTA